MSDIRPITELFSTTPSGEDWRDLGPTACCICGCDLMHVLARFDEKVVSFYYTDVMCAACGALLTAPTEVDE